MAGKTDIIDLTNLKPRCMDNLGSVAVVAIARLENQYINEWIDYHRKIGFAHFYVYDNSCGNEQRISSVLTKQNRNVTTVIPAYDKYGYQKQAYEDAYKMFGKLHDYMLFIDIDEFFTLTRHKTVSQYINYLNSKCPGFQQVRVHWELYGDNDAVERDMSIPVHEFFTKQADTPYARIGNYSTKHIVKTNLPGIYFPSVHFSQSFDFDLKTVNASGVEIHPYGQLLRGCRDVSVAKIRHYVTKTISEYMSQKLSRDDADSYLIRDIDNKFFAYCEKTEEKMAYYNSHKGMIKNEHSTRPPNAQDLSLVIFDSLDRAGDNGEAFYRQVRNRFPHLKIKFLLSPNCSDWERLKKDKFNLCSFQDGFKDDVLQNASCILWTKNVPWMDKLIPYRDKTIFLGHGVTSRIYNDDFYFRKCVNKYAKYVCCTSEMEADILKKYSNGQLQPIVSGYPRHDELGRNYQQYLDNPNPYKTVFIQFHWRLEFMKELNMFRDSEYLRNINVILNNERLRKLSEDGVRVLFLPHAMFMDRLQYFQIPKHVIVPKNMTFQRILIESDVLLTDFSSNQFEMAYMNKPSVSYIPDREQQKKFNRYNIQELKNYDHLSLCDSPDQAIEMVERKLYQTEKRNLARKVFKYVDGENTPRLVQSILENNASKWNGG